jgi:hypothetical protein
VTITRKRALSAVLGGGAAALGAACPPATATNDAQATRKAPAANSRPKPHRRPVARHGAYVYVVTIGGQVSTAKANMACSGLTVRLSGVRLSPEGKNASALWDKTPSAWRQRFTITSGAATTLTVPWSTPAELTEAEAHGGNVPNSRSLTGTAPASRVCAAAPPNAGVASVGEGVATWRLPKPIKSAAALLGQPPTNIDLNELSMTFAIRPNGTVTVSSPYA